MDLTVYHIAEASAAPTSVSACLQEHSNNQQAEALQDSEFDISAFAHVQDAQ